MRISKHTFLKITITLAAISFAFVATVNIYVTKVGDAACDKNAKKQAALVLGALVYSNGRLSDIFKDRIDAAIRLYEDKRVKKILVSGDNGTTEYNEVEAARKYLLEKNIPAEDIFLDHAGFDTYDSVYRAKEIFKAESLIIVTQNFHLPRALYIARKLGIDACGQSADLRHYVAEERNELREIPGRVKAWLNIVFHSRPKYLGQAIPLAGDGRNTW